MLRIFFVLLALVAVVLLCLAWPRIEPALESAVASLRPADARADGLPADWERRYDDVVTSLRHRAHALFARLVEVRADRLEATRSLDAGRAGLAAQSRTLDGLATAITSAADASAPLAWNGERFADASEARSVLLRWEGELMEGERALDPLAEQVRALAEAERSLKSARAKLTARADALERERTHRRARLDAVAARRALRAVGEVSRALDADPSLEELDRIVRLIDRELVVAEARESLEDEAASAADGTLEAAAARMDTGRRQLELETRVARRLERSRP